MEFIRRVARPPNRLGILPGSFNPITVAHMELARAALRCCDEVLFVLPRAFPHKEYTGATLEERVKLLEAAAEEGNSFSVGIADGGLFAEIAAECRHSYGDAARLTFLCGRDAAERIAGWNYENGVQFSTLLQKFDILVASRHGDYTPPPELSAFIGRLDVTSELDHVSATEVRRRIAEADAWEHLVPEAVREQVREIYGGRRSTGSGLPAET